jgi:hypothetical protein
MQRVSRYAKAMAHPDIEILRKLRFVSYYEEVEFIFYQPRVNHIIKAIMAVKSIEGFRIKSLSKSFNQ